MEMPNIPITGVRYLNSNISLISHPYHTKTMNKKPKKEERILISKVKV